MGQNGHTHGRFAPSSVVFFCLEVYIFLYIYIWNYICSIYSIYGIKENNIIYCKIIANSDYSKKDANNRLGGMARPKIILSWMQIWPSLINTYPDKMNFPEQILKIPMSQKMSAVIKNYVCYVIFEKSVMVVLPRWEWCPTLLYGHTTHEFTSSWKLIWIAHQV